MRLLQTLAVFMAAIIALLPLATIPVAEAEAATPRYNHKHIKHHPKHKPGTPYDHPHSRHHTPKPPPPPDPDPDPDPGPDTEPPNLVIVDMQQFGATIARTTWTIRANEEVEFYCDHEFARSISEENYQPCGSGTETTYSLPQDQIPGPGASPRPVTMIFKGVDKAGNSAERIYFYYVRQPY